MKCKILLSIITMLSIIISPEIGKAQTIGQLTQYVIYSGAGIVTNINNANGSNSTKSDFTGAICSQTSIPVGFGQPTKTTIPAYQGTILSTQAKTDAQNFLSYFTTADPSQVQTAGLGSANTTIAPGIYDFATLGNLSGTLTMDGQNDATKKFVFIYRAGLTIAGNTKIALSNLANAANIYWVVMGGNATIGSVVNFKGSLLTDTGAISMASADSLVGRLVSVSGPITVTYLVASATTPLPLPVNFSSLTAQCDNNHMVIKFSTASEQNNKFFTIQQSTDALNWNTRGMLEGAGNSSVLKNYAFVDSLVSSNVSYYRIMQTDINSSNLYSKVISVNACGNASTLSVSAYPNPSNGSFKVVFSGDKSMVTKTSVMDLNGKKVFESTGLKSTIDLTNQPQGMYLLKVIANSQTFTTKIMIQK